MATPAAAPVNAIIRATFRNGREILAGVLAKHDPASAGRRGESGQGSLRPYLDLPRASGSPKLFNAIGVHGGAGASVPEVPTAGAEGMWPLDGDIAGKEVKRLSPLHPMPLESLQEKLADGGVAIVRVEDIDVLGTEPSSLEHHAGRPVRS